MERDILADVNHPFVVKLHYGETTEPALAPAPPLSNCPRLWSATFPVPCPTSHMAGQEARAGGAGHKAQLAPS
jgi:hypothetical protein